MLTIGLGEVVGVDLLWVPVDIVPPPAAPWEGEKHGHKDKKKCRHPVAYVCVVWCGMRA